LLVRASFGLRVEPIKGWLARLRPVSAPQVEG
jgi:hypothetical protein